MDFRKLVIRIIACLLLVPMMLPIALAQNTADGDGILEPGENKTEELARAAQNPMANMISFPIQNNTNFNWGPLEKTQNVTNIQPVIPFNLGEDWLLISLVGLEFLYVVAIVVGGLLDVLDWVLVGIGVYVVLIAIGALGLTFANAWKAGRPVQGPES